MAQVMLASQQHAALYHETNEIKLLFKNTNQKNEQFALQTLWIWIKIYYKYHTCIVYTNIHDSYRMYYNCWNLLTYFYILKYFGVD
jgi:hypothetical protein